LLSPWVFTIDSWSCLVLAANSTVENEELELDLTILGLVLAKLLIEPETDLTRFVFEDDKDLVDSDMDLGRLTDEVCVSALFRRLVSFRSEFLLCISRRDVESHFLRILSGRGILESLVRLDDGVDRPEAVSSSGLSRWEPGPVGGDWL